MKYCKNSACKGADGYRRQKKSGFGGYCWTCGLQFEPTLEAGARAKEKAYYAKRKAKESLLGHSLCAPGKGANVKENVKHKCNTCELLLSKENVSASQLQYYSEEAQNKNLRCQEWHVCEICCKQLNGNEFAQKTRVCRQCDTQYKCSSCEVVLPPQRFSVSQLKHYREESQKKEFRCEDCHVCPTCNRKLDAHRFEGKGRVCRTCNEKDKCATCERMLSRQAFPPSQWHNRADQTYRQTLRREECHVCKTCS